MTHRLSRHRASFSANKHTRIQCHVTFLDQLLRNSQASNIASSDILSNLLTYIRPTTLDLCFTVPAYLYHLFVVVLSTDAAFSLRVAALRATSWVDFDPFPPYSRLQCRALQATVDRHDVTPFRQVRKGILVFQKTFGIAGASFLQAGCPSCHTANSVKAMKKNC